MTKTDEQMFMVVIKQRDELQIENDSLKRKLIMYKPHSTQFQTSLSEMLDKVIHERNVLQEQLSEAQDIIDSLLEKTTH
jgi:hypothetical protein